MSETNPARGKFANPQYCYTFTPARGALHGNQVWASFQHLRNWLSGQFVGAYSGRNVLAMNGNGNADFYVITGFPVKVDTTNPTRDLFIHLKNFQHTSLSGNESITWYDTIGGSSDTLFPASPVTDAVDDSWNPTGREHSLSASVTPVATSTNNGFKMSLLDCNGVFPSRFLVCGAPTGPTITNDQAITGQGQFSGGAPLKGIDASTTPDNFGTVGAIAYYQNTGDSAVHNTRSCLFQVCYPMGNFAENTTSFSSSREDDAGNDTTYKLTPRENLISGADLSCDVAMCITGDDGVQVKLSCATSGDSYTYTLSGAHTADLVTAAGVLDVNISGDKMKIETLTENGKSVVLHTVSVWEPYTIA